MTSLFVKALVSGCVVALVSFLAQRNPTFGGWVASAPIVSFLAVAWLVVDRASSRDSADFVLGVMVGLVPTAVVLFTLWLAINRGLMVPVALMIAVTVWAVTTTAVHTSGVLNS